MDPKEFYTSKDFKRYARKEFPTDYALFRERYVCTFEAKTHLDANHAAHNINALLVGSYHVRQGGPLVWAQATAIGIRYFSGKETDAICMPISEKHVNRIYYSSPYSPTFETQDGRSRTAGREAVQYFAETIINVLFLLTGRLQRVGNPGKTDMLSNFRYVCVNVKPVLPCREDGLSAVPRQPEVSPTDDSVERVRKKRKRSFDEHGQRIKEEEDESKIVAHIDNTTHSTDLTRPSQALPLRNSRPHSPTPHWLESQSTQMALLDQRHDYETKLEQQKHAHLEAVEKLQAKLEQQKAKLGQQELKTLAAEAETFGEREKCKRVKKQMEAMRRQTSMHAEVTGSSVGSCVLPDGHACELRIHEQKAELITIRKALEMRNRTIGNLRATLKVKERGSLGTAQFGGETGSSGRKRMRLRSQKGC